MKSNRSSVLFFFILLALLHMVMLIATQLTPVAQSARLSDSPATLDWSSAIMRLTIQADLVAEAQVVDTRSQWNSDHTIIETVHTLAVAQPLVGNSTSQLLVYTDGGFLADEGLGMVSSHTPRFAVGEAVLVFLQKGATGYSVVGGEAGKFTILNADAVSAYYRAHLPLNTLRALLTTPARAAPIPMPSNRLDTAAPAGVLRTDLSSNRPLATPTVLPKWDGAAPKIKVQVNLNSTQIGGQGGSADQFLTAIKNALRTWSVVPDAEVTLLYDGTTTATTTGLNSKSEILFMKKGTNSQLGQAQIWFTSNGVIVEADIWINDDYLLDATGNADSNEIDLESAVLHELGHWLPLSHVPNPDAIMYALLGAGVRKVDLRSDDLAGIATLYPCPVLPCIDPIYADSTITPTATVAPTASTMPMATITPTSVATPTVTATPTLLPSAVTPTPPLELFLPFVTR